DEIIKKRLGEQVIGFSENTDEIELEKPELLAKVLPVDLLAFGLIPELIGRLPIIASLQPLYQDTLIEILTTPKNTLVKQYQKLFELVDIELEFEIETLVELANTAIQRNRV